ncbi:MAG TPA: PAS domain S-box protein [Bacteroidales bacterium]|nr:PAS domain S-box protein [Bacteroidales bacterium]
MKHRVSVHSPDPEIDKSLFPVSEKLDNEVFIRQMVDKKNSNPGQLVDFFYSQLIDAFVLFSVKTPVHWKNVTPGRSNIRTLAGKFRVADLNDALTLQCGIGRKDLLGMTLREFFGNGFESNLTAWNTLIQTGEVFSEFIAERKDGSTLWTEGHYKCIRDSMGNIAGIAAIQRDISQRKRAIRESEATEARMRMLAHLSFQGILILQQGKALEINIALSKLTGYSRKEIIDDNCMASAIPEKYSRKLFRKSWTDQSETFETSLLCKDGKSIAVEIETQVVQYNNIPRNVIGFHDISNRKRIEDEIVKLSVALDQSANEIVITRKNGEIEYVNRAFTTVTGYTPSEVIGKNPRILKSGSQSPLFYEKMWQTLLKGQQWVGEFQNRKKNGELYWESATITPIKNKDSDIVRYIAIKEDITFRRKAEQSLRESEEKFRSMVSNIPGVVYRCAFDVDWTVFFITNAIGSLTGYKPAGFMFSRSKTFTSLIHPEDREKVNEAVRNSIIKSGQYSIEHRIITSNDGVKWVSNSGRPVFNDDNTLKWLDGFLFDINERVLVVEELKKAKIAAEEANKAKSEFLANISHEIRTPLNSVLGFTELLEGMTFDSTQIKYLNSIKASGKNLMMLINDLLDLSKIEAGKMTLHFAFFDIHRLMDEIRNVFSLRVAIKGIGYHEELDENFPAEIRFDETRLRQIFINLVGNAIKFTHEGEVTIKVRALSRKSVSGQPTMRLEIKVMDTGIGIPENSFKLIFESFRQHSQLNSRKYGGTGLGLAITKRLVEAMNGRIKLESTVGMGSVFTLTFPEVAYSDIPSNSYISELLFKDNTNRDSSKRISSVEEKHEAYLLDGQVDLSIIKEADYQVLVKRFEQELAAKWKLFETKQPLKEIRSFAQEIIILGKSFKLRFVTEYGEQLLTTIENFDIEEMRVKIDLFPDLLKQLKKISHETR